jgi:hypothetical protein
MRILLAIPGLQTGPVLEAEDRFRTILSEIAGGPGLNSHGPA